MNTQVHIEQEEYKYSPLLHDISIIFCTDKEQCSKWIQSNVYDCKLSGVGFDTESLSSFHTKPDNTHSLALIQIATPDQVLLVSVYGQSFADLPVNLVKLIQDHVLKKFVMDARCDVRELRKVGFKPNTFIDIQVSTATTAVQQQSKPIRQGIKTLAKQYLGLELYKNKKITCSNWTKLPLSGKQLEYAALDALMVLALAETLHFTPQPLLCSKWNHLVITQHNSLLFQRNTFGQVQLLIRLKAILVHQRVEWIKHADTDGYIDLQLLIEQYNLTGTVSDIVNAIKYQSENKHETFHFQLKQVEMCLIRYAVTNENHGSNIHCTDED